MTFTLPSQSVRRALDKAHEQGFRRFCDEHSLHARQRASDALVELMDRLTAPGRGAPDYDDPYVAAAYMVKYHLSHCMMAYWAFERLFDRIRVPRALYVCDVGSGTGAARVGLAVALSEREESPSIHFGAIERSCAMHRAGNAFWNALPQGVRRVVPRCDYGKDAAGLKQLPPEIRGRDDAMRVVTAFHLSLPYDSENWVGIDSTERSIRSALDLACPHIGLFTANSNKKGALAWVVDGLAPLDDRARWDNSLSSKHDIPKDHEDVSGNSRFYTACAEDLGFTLSEGSPARPVREWSRHRFSLPKDSVLLWRVSRDEEQRQAAMRAEEERRRRERKAAQRAEVERRAKAERAEREHRERAERAAAERQRERREQALTYKDRGVAHAGKGEYDRAIRAYDQALRLDPNYVEAYCGRGSAYWSTRKYDRAIQDFNQALQFDPQCVRSHYGRGVTYASKDEYDGAIHAYKQALRLAPNYAKARNGRGTAYWHQGQYDRAIEDFNQALRLDPNQARTYFNRGLAYRCKGEYRRAESDFCKALTLGYNRAKVEAQLAELRQERERRAQAEAERQAAVGAKGNASTGGPRPGSQMP